MNNYFTFTTVKNFYAEVKIVRATERFVAISDYPDITFIYRISPL